MSDKIWRKRTLLLGVALWAIPFVVGFLAFPIKGPSPVVFKAIMSVALVGATVGISNAYLRSAAAFSRREGLLLGLAWAAISVLLDLPIFLGLFHMPAARYLLEIGLAYLVIPAITWGQVSLLEAARQRG